MNEPCLSRRRALLSGSALVLGVTAAAIATSQANAQEKLGQADAQYQMTPKDDQHCGVCSNFRPPNGCQFVQGDINPNGWCQLFTPKS